MRVFAIYYPEKRPSPKLLDESLFLFPVGFTTLFIYYLLAFFFLARTATATAAIATTATTITTIIPTFGPA